MEINTSPGEIIGAVLIPENERRQTKKRNRVICRTGSEKKKGGAKKNIGEEKKGSAFERSRIASEKLKLAWIKANITLIALGFAVYKFYQSRLDHGQNPIGHYVTGRHVGLFLTLVGVAALSVATWQHFHKVDQLKLKFTKKYHSVSLVLSYVVPGFDIAIMVIILFHL